MMDNVACESLIACIAAAAGWSHLDPEALGTWQRSDGKLDRRRLGIWAGSDQGTDQSIVELEQPIV